MGAEPTSGWTIQTLKEHFEQRFTDQNKAVETAFSSQKNAIDTAMTAADRAVQAALTAADRAVAKAETAAEKRFEGLNEFRGTLTDQQKTFITRDQSFAETGAIREKIEGLEKMMNVITSRIDINAGRGKGLDAGWAYMLGAVGSVIGVAGVAVAFWRR